MFQQVGRCPLNIFTEIIFTIEIMVLIWLFKVDNKTDDGLAEYMRYRKADEDVIFSKDIYVNQDKKAYFHREAGKNSYIVNENTAGVNHFKLYNQ